MLRAHPQKQRRFPCPHKSGPMMKQDLVQSKILRRGIGNDCHLMLSHGFLRFVIDPLDFTTIFPLSNHPPKIDYRSGGKACPERSRRIDIFFGRFQSPFSQQNLRNRICHAFELPVTV